MAGPTIDAGVLVSHSSTADVERLHHFARRITETSGRELKQATDANWKFHFTERTRLSDDDARRPSDFLDEASLQMVEGPYDFVVVVTDVGLVSSRHSIVGGLASPASGCSFDPCFSLRVGSRSVRSTTRLYIGMLSRCYYT